MENRDEMPVIGKNSVLSPKARLWLDRYAADSAIVEAVVTGVTDEALSLNVENRKTVHLSRRFLEPHFEALAAQHFLGLLPSMKVLVINHAGNPNKWRVMPVPDANANMPEGAMFDAIVVEVRHAGAVLRIGQHTALLHKSEMSWSPMSTDRFASQLAAGDPLQVRVMSQLDNHLLHVSHRACTLSPWRKSTEHLRVGAKLSGVVKSVTSYGLFIDVLGGVTGLLHFDEAAGEATLLRAAENTRINVTVKAIDHDKEQVTLTQLSLAP